MSPEYQRYLLSPTWRAFREEMLWARDFTCERCGTRCPPKKLADGKRLEVHHLTYERLGFELPSDVQVLCSVCHSETHGIPPLLGVHIPGWESVSQILHQIEPLKRMA